MSAYKKLCHRYGQIYRLQRSSAILSWEKESDMPKGGETERRKLQTCITQTLREKRTDKKIAGWLEQAQQKKRKDDLWQQRNLELMKQDYKRDCAVSKELSQKVHKAKKQCSKDWEEAKTKDDWSIVKDSFSDYIDLLKEKAKREGDAIGLKPYDSLLFDNCRANREDYLDTLFQPIYDELPQLIRDIRKKQGKQKLPSYHINKQVQEKIAKELAGKLCFDFDRGRLEQADSPVAGGSVYYVLIRANFEEDKPFNSLYGAIHETGHALYKFGLPEKYWDQPVGSDEGKSLHESQSLFMERQIGQSEVFLRAVFKTAQDHVPELAERDPDEFVRFMHYVEPTPIRTEADEVTYPLHILLRYEAEKQIFNDKMKVADLPEFWNARFAELLETDPPKTLEDGCLQDVHWSKGEFGYFPAYLQGTIFAAQLADAMAKDIPDYQERAAKGECGQIVAWLHEKIHSQGQLYQAPDLIERATGRQPDPKIFLNMLRKRYLG